METLDERFWEEFGGGFFRDAIGNTNLNQFLLFTKQELKDYQERVLKILYEMNSKEASIAIPTHRMGYNQALKEARRKIFELEP